MKALRQAVASLALLSVLALAPPARAWFPVATGPAEQLAPAISGRRVAWTEERSGMWDVFVRDLDTGTERNVSNIVWNLGFPNSFARAPAISGDLVAWVEREPTLGERNIVVVHDVVAGTTRRITTSRVASQQVAIDGHRVVWTDIRNGVDVYAYDLVAGTETLVTGDTSALCSEPDISRDRVVFACQTGTGGRDVYLHDLAAGTTVALTTNGASTNPAIGGDKVVWSDTSKPDYAKDVVLFDVPTATATRITNNVSAPTFTRTSVYPDTDGVKVVWLQFGEFKLDDDPWEYDIATGTARPITLDPTDQGAPSISDGRVVYVDRRSGSADVCLNDPADEPVANAGPDQSAHPGDTVVLDGTRSQDPDLDHPLTYAWRFVSHPTLTRPVLSDAASPSPTFLSEGLGDYVLELVVTDATGHVSEPDRVKVGSGNAYPIADAGPDQLLADVPTLVTLDGSKSFDADGDPMKFQWILARVPAGSTATLAKPDAPVTTFTADVRGTYQAVLIVTDAWGGSSDSVVIGTENLLPVADAGGNQSALVGAPVTLDGTGSSDPDGDPLRFAWSIASAPVGSKPVVDGANYARATLRPDLVGEYVVVLVVCEALSKERCDKDVATIEVLATQDYSTQTLQDTGAVVNAIPLEGVAMRGATSALTQRINVVLRFVDQGRYAQAIDQLENGVLPRTDGCLLREAPDADDWITDCAAQAEIHASVIDVIAALRASAPKPP